ncbi:MAG TPA: alpha-(1-_3)-arabinofuranosyltransferase family protein [Thermoleophilaceae bacterium]|nr:alpha-(1->3)-arabinofuranosyltransferase family protein [Thermoleophilaceae bacterium]
MNVDRIEINDSPGRGGWRWLPLLLALAAYVLAFAQRTGELVADTKIDLHTDPVRFLADAAAAWAPSGGLGQVQAGQYAGYLWPMGPFYALGDLIGLAPWVVHRLWLGTLLAVAAWGVVRLLDALLERPRGVPALVAGVLVIANPYVVVFANRTSITLLAYALLPWLLLCVQRGLREPRGWWWPAALALLVTSLGGGVNAAVAGWVLLGPALLILYEAGSGAVGWRNVGRFLLRALPLTALASAWWIAPILVQVRYGVDFLPFTEPAGAIWTSTSMSESLRLMGFWVTYLGVGYGTQLSPAFDTAPTLLGAQGLILAAFVIPGLAIAGFAWTRRWRYGPFFAALTLLALLVMFTGFPDGAPLRRALHWSYDRVELVQFLRTTYKVGPLLALALACLAGVAAGLLWERMRGRIALALAASAAAAALVVGWAWPLFEVRAVDGQISFDAVPAGWERAAADVDDELPRGTRALVLPGQVFPFYRWGGTQDALLPALTDRPVSVRGVVPYADLRAVDLLWATDALVQQQRVLPGQLTPLIRLMGAGAVVAANDDDRDRSGAVDSVAAGEQLERGAGLLVPVDGRDQRAAGADPGAEARRFGAVRAYPVARPSGLVRVQPLRAPLVVDGSAATLAGLAALGGLPRERAILYAADLSGGELRRAARGGSEIVVGDSNRRRVILPSQPRQAEGATLAAEAEIPSDGAVLNPFADRGPDAQTVAVYDGAAELTAPFSPSFVQFPEHRPFAAFDGDPATWWSAERNFDDDRRWIEIDFGRRIDVPTLALLSQREARTELREVEIAGGRYPIRPGWNRLPVGLRDIEKLRVSITGVEGPPTTRTRGPGAIAELRIPGVRVRERLRPPVVATRALAGEDLRHAPLAFLFERTTGDEPFHRRARIDPDSTSVPSGDNQSAALVAAAGDGETSIARRFELPAARRWRADGWVTVAPGQGRAVVARYGDGGRLDIPCGAVAARVTVRRASAGGRATGEGPDGDGWRGVASTGRARLPLRPVGSVTGVLSGRPLRARSCGAAVAVPAGLATLTIERGPLRTDLLRMRSLAPRPLRQPVSPGRVLDPGGDGRGRRDDVSVALAAPAWLVLAESFNRGWRAACDGRDLGKPQPIDGFANGWRAPRDCRHVDFAFAPQRTMNAGFAISALACIALLALVLLGARRRRRRTPTVEPGVSAAISPKLGVPRGWNDGEGSALPLRWALAIGAAAGLAGAFLFALRAGVVIGPAVALLLWRGVGPAALALTAGLLTAVVLPVIYLLFPPDDAGGFNSEFAVDLTGAHWVAVAVWVLFALAVALAVSTASRRRRAAVLPGGDAESAAP